MKQYIVSKCLVYFTDYRNLCDGKINIQDKTKEHRLILIRVIKLHFSQLLFVRNYKGNTFAPGYFAYCPNVHLVLILFSSCYFLLSIAILPSYDG